MKLDRENKLLIGLCAMAGILIVKLFSIQIIEDKYKQSAENNTKVYTTIYPTRGIIHDRNGKILVGNKVAYDLMVTPSEVEKFDTLALAQVLDVTPEFIVEKMAEYATVPLIAKPNAGLPTVVDGSTVYDVTAEDFASSLSAMSHASRSPA